ncbi:MAG TPA: amidohydrolase [Lacipirellulaceae bacterium]|nr:amidohydrolase [Lacipirellulaceae bacterium]
MNTTKVSKRPIFGNTFLCALLPAVVVLAAFPCLNAVLRAADTTDPRQWVTENMPSLVELYRHLHQTPELSTHEKETSARMAKELRDAGAEVTTNVGGYGVVGVLKNGSGKVLLLRSDMDALPVVEETGLPYASKIRTKDAHGVTVGVMHACGHDVHMTNLIGVARYLASHRDAWSGTIDFVFQPAEETGSGAEAMIQDGLFSRFPQPNFAVALHDSADVPTGKITYHPGYMLANVDSVDIVIKGRGGHGASPEATIDPIVIAAKLVLDLQTIVSRELKPTDPAVVTVGSIHAGTKHNIISGECRLQLTLRSFSPQVRKHLQESVRRKAYAAAESAGAPKPTVEISEGTPSLFNDPELTQRIATILKHHLGDDAVEQAEAVMGGEDFSRYQQPNVPICMYRLGAVNQKRLDAFAASHVPPTSLHSALFYPDIEETLAVGVPSMVYIATDLLKHESK